MALQGMVVRLLNMITYLSRINNSLPWEEQPTITSHDQIL